MLYQSSNNNAEFLPPKPYAARLKRHKDAIMTLYSPLGDKGDLMVSGSADEKLRVWNMKEKKISESIHLERPSDYRIIQYQQVNSTEKSEIQEKTKNDREAASFKQKQPTKIESKNPGETFDSGNLNLFEMQNSKKRNIFLTCIAFCGSKAFTAYEDGLICAWYFDDSTHHFMFPMIGHSNRVNHLLSNDD